MENYYLKYIYCGEVEIAASCEDSAGEVMKVYYPNTLLFYTQIGQLNIRIDKELFSLPKGEFGLIRKYTEADFFKSWNEKENYAKTYGFALTNSFIRKVIKNVSISSNTKPTAKRFIPISKTKELNELMQTLIQHVDNNQDLDAKYVENKTFETLTALVNANEQLGIIFKEFSLSERADLEKLMAHNFLFNIPLEMLAQQSGRSLSTFNREFRMIFNDTPHKWIMKKRLQHARNLMVTEGKRPSAIYLECGFEDLTHFSRAFKKQFQVAPSVFIKNIK